MQTEPISKITNEKKDKALENSSMKTINKNIVQKFYTKLKQSLKFILTLFFGLFQVHLIHHETALSQTKHMTASK